MRRFCGNSAFCLAVAIGAFIAGVSGAGLQRIDEIELGDGDGDRGDSDIDRLDLISQIPPTLPVVVPSPPLSAEEDSEGDLFGAEDGASGQYADSLRATVVAQRNRIEVLESLHDDLRAQNARLREKLRTERDHRTALSQDVHVLQNELAQCERELLGVDAICLPILDKLQQTAIEVLELNRKWMEDMDPQQVARILLGPQQVAQLLLDAQQPRAYTFPPDHSSAASSRSSRSGPPAIKPRSSSIMGTTGSVDIGLLLAPGGAVSRAVSDPLPIGARLKEENARQERAIEEMAKGKMAPEDTAKGKKSNEEKVKDDRSRKDRSDDDRSKNDGSKSDRSRRSSSVATVQPRKESPPRASGEELRRSSSRGSAGAVSSKSIKSRSVNAIRSVVMSLKSSSSKPMPSASAFRSRKSREPENDDDDDDDIAISVVS